MDKATRSRLQSITQEARRLLEEEFSLHLEGDFNILRDGTVLPEPGAHLDPVARLLRVRLVAAINHRRSAGMDAKSARDALLREASFTTLNRFVALKMLEARGVVQECVSQGDQSRGFREFGGLAPGLIALPDRGYRLYLESLFDEVGREVRVLFDRRDVAGQLWPRRMALTELLGLLNSAELSQVWGENETIGWVYQYFNDEDERRKMRDESAVPRNSRELAVRNQFFTPQYVVAFLADNTLGRIWYEMRGGQTRLADLCALMVRRPGEALLARELRDPRELRVLDPAVGSGHYLLYCFDLLLAIYEETWDQCPELLGDLRAEYASKADFMAHAPRLILAFNLYGVDIDERAAQIAELALWMRAQRAYAAMQLRGASRPPIRKTNIIVAEPMPGDRALLAQLLQSVDARLRSLVERIWQAMQMAGEAGTLLKIEELVRVELDRAERAALAGGAAGDQLMIDGGDAGERSFWERAERELLVALEGAAAYAVGADGARRRLFAENAARGFALIDLCRQRYDVVLMNPPFGAVSRRWKAEFEKTYPRTKNDLYAAFVERGLGLLRDNGMLGAITSRTGFFLTSFQRWREMLLHEARPFVFADLGYGVLDSAMVETAAYCLRHSHQGETTFFHLAPNEDKADALGNAVSNLCDGNVHNAVFVNASSFDQIPGRPFAYRTPRHVFDIFRHIEQFESPDRFARGGMGSLDDFRFLRAWWEVRAHTIGSSKEDLTDAIWFPYAKGGTASAFYSPILTVINFAKSGLEVKRLVEQKVGNASRNIRSESFYFRKGIIFGRRIRRFSPAIFSSGAIFSDSSNAVFIEDNDSDKLLACLGILNGSVVRYLLSLIVPIRKMEVGFFQKLPVPSFEKLNDGRLSDLAVKSANLRRASYSTEELSHLFWLPALLQVEGVTLAECVHTWQRRVESVEAQLVAQQREIDDIVFDLYGIKGQDRTAIEVSLKSGGAAEEASDAEDAEVEDDGDEESVVSAQAAELVADLVSYAIGAALGRWDLRCIASKRQSPKLPDLFASLPVRSPGMLAETPGTDYPIRVRSMLVDDAGHPDDIVTAVREVFAAIWGQQADTRLQEAVAVLDPSADDLRRWLRTSFFEAHIKRYAKSRRRAPIYWRLSTLSRGERSYAVWMAYHQFTKDSLYRALNDYVGPKLRLEERRLAAILSDGGANPTVGQRRTIDAQEGFVNELRAFREELVRVAPLWDTDLNDGVIINYAPLWRLAPWPRTWQKECRQTWEALVRGDYDWSALAMRLWPERVVPKCASDRSLAIAHGLDERLWWREGSDGKATPRNVSDAELRAIISERTVSAVQAALLALDASPYTLETPKKRRAEPKASSGQRGRKPKVEADQLGMELDD